MFKEYLQSIIVALLISFFIITFVVQAFYIPSGSMLPTLKPGDRIFANKFIYRFREPKRQEIIVFKWPVNPKRRFIKRLIGLPGDEVKIVEGQVYINDKPLEEDYTLERSYTDFPEVKVPKGHYFMLGDNRNNSEDSRFWGFVPRKNILGKAFVIFWPLDRMGLIREGN
ncbi:signal peptidase I [Orenia metallireducens]|uniref:Signal peptidase I n=1 Tax=Orenia metallireducens TaxID=1413210 RepID=A0A1C0A9T2_9FIRM|nr:signal peptidase I [Orenia metallireducens]OCL27057.1 signal peptidase I [Orenia metallireducens]